MTVCWVFVTAVITNIPASSLCCLRLTHSISHLLQFLLSSFQECPRLYTRVFLSLHHALLLASPSSLVSVSADVPRALLLLEAVKTLRAVRVERGRECVCPSRHKPTQTFGRWTQTLSGSCSQIPSPHLGAGRTHSKKKPKEK